VRILEEPYCGNEQLVAAVVEDSEGDRRQKFFLLALEEGIQAVL
jgi:hypothetical protein